MSLPSRPELVTVLLAQCEDAFFGVCAESALDPDNLRALARRRAASRKAGVPLEGMASWDGWILSLCAAIAPIAPPRWMPLADTVGELSLEGGPRGVRALFSSKPSDKEIQRVRALGAFAVRVIGAVYASTGSYHQEARLLRASALASLGLPPDDQRALADELPVPAERLDVVPMEARLARTIVEGAFQAAMSDGVDPREEQAIEIVGRKLLLTADDLAAARQEARAALEAARPVGEAAVDAIRFVLSDEAPASERFAIAAARLCLPSIYRHEAITAVNVGGAVTLARKRKLERKPREAALALAWLAALSTDPPYGRRVELAVRHDMVSADLGAYEAGALVRAVIEQHIETELGYLWGSA